MITILAYSPVVNACEKLILNIKTKVRKLEREGKEISLATFKRVIDSNTNIWAWRLCKS